MLNILSTARSKILVELKNRPHTVSELSKVTGYSKSTVVYHLDRLNKVGYVRRIERGKWVYYSLTKSGLNALKYEVAKMGFLLIGGLTSLIYGILSLIKFEGERYKLYREIPKKPEVFGTDSFAYSLILLGLTALILFLILKFRDISLKSKRS